MNTTAVKGDRVMSRDLSSQLRWSTLVTTDVTGWLSAVYRQ